MTQLLTVLVPVAVALITTFRWQTLPRRLRSHLALVKELPDGVDASALHELIGSELSEVVRQGRKRLDRRADRLVLAFQWALVVAGVTGVVDGYVSGLVGYDPLAPFTSWRFALVLGLVAAVLTAAWTVAGVLGRSFKRSFGDRMRRPD